MANNDIGTRAGQPGNADLMTVLLAEYEQLKTEQAQRIGHRDQLVYATLTAAGAAVIGAVQAHTTALLLALPPVCALLGWTHLANDDKVSAIGRYLRHDLAPRLAGVVGEPVLGWETSHRDERHRARRKVLQLAANLLTFVLPGAAAIVAAAVHRPARWLLLTAGAEVVLLAVLAWQVAAHADLTPDRPTRPPAGPGSKYPTIDAPGS
jgi:chromate transport protein ChrA